MERSEALEKIRKLEGKNLLRIAEEFEVTVWKDGKLNKGWAGHTIERYLGLPLNSSRSPNFGSWELKLVSLNKSKKGELVPKETMAITMLDVVEVRNKPFKESHLFTKLRKAVVCARIFESKEEKSSFLYKAVAFDLEGSEMFDQIEKDYEEVRSALKNDKVLTGKMGVLIQPRTKGPGHGSTSRAFYARKIFIAKILGLGGEISPTPPAPLPAGPR